MPDVHLVSNSSRRKELAAKLKSQPPPGTRSAFRVSEKVYLSRNPPPNYEAVIDFHSLTELHHWRDTVRTTAALPFDSSERTRELFGSHNGKDALQIFTIKNHPGALFIPGALTPEAQRRLVKSCLREATKAPNLNNLDTHYVLPANGIWHHFENNFRCPEEHEDIVVKTVRQLSGVQHADSITSGPRKLVMNDPLTKEALPETLTTSKEAPKPSASVKSERVSTLMYKLRWTNLGLQYHWTTKSYHFENILAPGNPSVIHVPSDLSDISKIILRSIPSKLLPQGQNWQKFQPESGIINFYQLKDTLMGHIDQSELVEEEPLVSISLGHAAVFLLGGTTRNETPTAVYLRSGDILIMSGESRRVYHGVPRIIEGTLPEHLTSLSELSQNGSEEDPDWDVFARYLSTSRININVRQVFPKDYLQEHISKTYT